VVSLPMQPIHSHRVVLNLNSAGPQSGLPLGTNSSFLRAAIAAAVAPSRAYGLWTGSRSLAPVDGLLIIGGYDASRINGPFTNFSVGNGSLKSPCPLQVTVTGLSYAGVSLFGNGSQTMDACIDPGAQKFVFTPSVTSEFAAVTRQNSSFYKGLTFPANNPPLGNLTITLNNGYKTTITNNELFTYLRGSDANGRYAITNNTVVDSGISDNRASNPSSVVPTLGGLFLTFNYLVVDYEANMFRLAPAVSSSVNIEASNITTICTPKVQSPPSSTSTSPPQSTTSAVSSTPR
jgi:hypothetical protein